MNFGAILAGGSGTRMHGSIPKQFLMLGGCPVLIRTLRVFLQCSELAHIYIAAPADWIGHTRQLVQTWCPEASVTVLPGGGTRTDTLFALMDAIERRYGSRPDDRVVTHDAVRPFVTVQMIRDNIAAAADTGASGTAIPAVDTILQSEDGRVIDSIPPRGEMYQMQTPQTFSIPLLRATYASLTRAEKARLTDGCGVLVARGIPVRLSPGSPMNIKITTPIDLEMAQVLVQRMS